MERFDSLLEAAEFAAARCKSWSFLLQMKDMMNKVCWCLLEMRQRKPIDEDSFYVVSPSGAIGIGERRRHFLAVSVRCRTE